MASHSRHSNTMLAGLNCTSHIHLIIGTNPLAASRCTQSLAAGASPIIIAPATSTLHYTLQAKIDDSLVTWKQRSFEDDDLFRLGREEIDHVVDAVFVTSGPREPLSIHISNLCKRHRIPVNVVDAPALCTFSLLSTHTDGPLQIGVTTNGRGCKLASRIRREIASSLPKGLGGACAKLGEMRTTIQEDDYLALGDLDDSVDQSAQFNRLVHEEDVRNRRMRWLSQVCEYWPLRRLASIGDEDVEKLLAAYSGLGSQSKPSSSIDGAYSRDDTKPQLGRVILAGSGPGHPDLLTNATLKAIQTSDLILADKLVPSGVLDLIPRRTPVHIARKFPGNADKAQEELLESALEGVRAGKTVLRLKQGDPFIYGRGGEEVAFFKARGMASRVTVLPGVTSALSAPLFASIPPTQRDVADQVLICTGTGKKGKPPTPPEYVASRTVVFLMALHRITSLVTELTTHMAPSSPGVEEELQTVHTQSDADTKRTLWPLNTPCAVIERASCPDQRVIRTTLAHVAEAIESEGSRPPGLLVVGGACEVLFERTRGQAWIVEEGIGAWDIDQNSTIGGGWLGDLQVALTSPETRVAVGAGAAPTIQP